MWGSKKGNFSCSREEAWSSNPKKKKPHQIFREGGRTSSNGVNVVDGAREGGNGFRWGLSLTGNKGVS